VIFCDEKEALTWLPPLVFDLFFAFRLVKPPVNPFSTAGD